MVIDNKILDDLSAQAKASPRLRMNYDLRNSAEDKSQRMLNAVPFGQADSQLRVESLRLSAKPTAHHKV